MYQLAAIETSPTARNVDIMGRWIGAVVAIPLARAQKFWTLMLFELSHWVRTARAKQKAGCR
jgi:hypothetical protein